MSASGLRINFAEDDKANQRMAAAASARLEPSRQAWVSTSVPGPQRLPLCSSIGWRG